MRMLLMGVLLVPALAQAAVVDRVLIRQQWPWKTEVKVDYRVTGLTEAVDVTPTFYDGETELPAPGFDANYVGDVKYVFQDGNHSFTFDPKTVFGLADGASLEHLRVKLTLTPTACPANYADKLYRIIDLRSGEITDLYRADFYNRKYGAFETSYEAVRGESKVGTYRTTLDDEFIWTGVTNNPAYKTTKMVFRYVNCKNRIWEQGCDSDYSGNKLAGATPAHPAMLTENYFISVFKVTQAQYFQIVGDDSGAYLNVTNEVTQLEDHTLPIYDSTMVKVRGVRTHLDPTETSFFGRMRKLSGLAVELPTDAQWEYAGRAECVMGKTKAESGSYPGNMPNGSCALTYIAHVATANTKPAPVGSYQPNAFGLYDVVGNGQEMIYDDYIAFNSEAFLAQTNAEGVVVDPLGPHVGSGNYTRRSYPFSYSGSAGAGNRFMAMFVRNSNSSSAGSFRVKIPEEAESESAVVIGSSEPTEVLVNPEAWCPFWHTASNASFTVRWITPIYGSPAKLTVTGLCGAPSLVHDNLTEDSCTVTWPVQPSDFRSEDVLTLTLDFADGSSKTTTLGLVDGYALSDETAVGTRFIGDSTGTTWAEVPCKAVAAVPPDTLSLTNGTEEVAITPGMTWLGLGPLKSGVELPLTLVTDAETVEQVVFGETLGTLLIIK